jgi:hypothetical protein
VQSTDLSVVIEELEIEGEEDSELPQLLPQLMPLTLPLHVASLSEHEKRPAMISSFNNYDFARGVPGQRQSYDEREVQTTDCIISGVIASIALDRFFEAEGFIFNK